MHCTCTDINKFLAGLFAYVPSMISEEKTVGLCTGYRIVKGVNILQSQRCSSSSTRRIETYPARRKRFSKLTRATQQEQAISVWKSVISIESRFDTNSSSTNAQKHFWVKLYSSFLSQLQVYRTTKIFWVHILRCLAKDMKLFTPQVKTLVSKCPVSKWPVTLIPFLF